MKDCGNFSVIKNGAASDSKILTPYMSWKKQEIYIHLFKKKRLWVSGAQREYYLAKENESRHNECILHTNRLQEHSFNSPLFCPFFVA